MAFFRRSPRYYHFLKVKRICEYNKFTRELMTALPVIKKTRGRLKNISFGTKILPKYRRNFFFHFKNSYLSLYGNETSHGVLWPKLGRKSISKGQTTFFWKIGQYENIFSTNQNFLSSRFWDMVFNEFNYLIKWA